MNRVKSESLMQRALKVIPGGVNSPVRAFKGVGGTPIFFESSNGPYMTDVDGNQFIDYVGSWGPLIHGHCFPETLNGIKKQAGYSLGFGAPTELEIKIAELIVERVPSIDLVRMVNSGTEATMTAIRLARGFTGRDKIVKFEGCYHGHSDSLLVKAGSGVLTFGLPDSPGVPTDLAKHTLNSKFNDIEKITELFHLHGDDIAAVIVEPIAGNMGCIPAEAKFLETLKLLTQKFGSLLIFDEVMTGFRVGFHSAQGLYNILPDLTTLGKVIGGGLPVGAVGGSKEVMNRLAPSGDIYQAGTLSGNPLTIIAGISVIESLTPQSYEDLKEKTDYLVTGLTKAAHVSNVPVTINVVCGMFSLFFTDQNKISDYQLASECNVKKYTNFFHGMLEEGVYFAPSAFEAAFISTTHGEIEIEKTIEAANKVMPRI